MFEQVYSKLVALTANSGKVLEIRSVVEFIFSFDNKKINAIGYD